MKTFQEFVAESESLYPYDHVFVGAKVQPKGNVDKKKPFTVHRIVSDDTAEVKDEYGNKHKMLFKDLLPHKE